jgi:hypothetical protein
MHRLHITIALLFLAGWQTPASAEMAEQSTRSRLEVYARPGSKWADVRATMLQIIHSVPLAFDANGDGVVSKDEFLTAVKDEFDRIDTDGDETISEVEAQRFKTELKAARTAKDRADKDRRIQAEHAAKVKACDFPPVPPGAKVILVSAHGGSALSSVSLGGNDEEVTVANIRVEPGPEPLFVVLSSFRAMVWQFSGSAKRIAGVAATSAVGSTGLPRVGITGLPMEKVAISAAIGCLPYATDKAESQQKLSKAAEDILGAQVDALTAIEHAANFAIPSGVHEKVAFGNQVQLPTTGPGVPLWREMLHFYPGGLIRIDPDEVVSRVPAKRYEVLPQQAGLAQLLEEGALKVARYSRSIRLGEGPELSVSSEEFLIQRR